MEVQFLRAGPFQFCPCSSNQEVIAGKPAVGILATPDFRLGALSLKEKVAGESPATGAIFGLVV